MWLSQLRRLGPTGLQAPIPTFTTFFPDGTSLASPSDGNQTATHGLWIRVGDRKFLGTGYFFSFDAGRALTALMKLRINSTGKVLNTFPGSTFSMVRLSPEIPADFYDFQKLP